MGIKGKNCSSSDTEGPMAGGLEGVFSRMIDGSITVKVHSGSTER
jgi:hypothetical protein